MHVDIVLLEGNDVRHVCDYKLGEAPPAELVTAVDREPFPGLRQGFRAVVPDIVVQNAEVCPFGKREELLSVNASGY